MLRTLLRKTTLILTALIALAVLGAGTLEAAGEVVRLDLRVVYADKSGGGVDDAVRPIYDRLSQLFDYTHYRLESQESRSAVMDADVSLPLPGGRTLILRPTGRDADGRFRVELSISGLVKTDFRLKDGGTLILGGPRFQDGVLILVISLSAV